MITLYREMNVEDKMDDGKICCVLLLCGHQRLPAPKKLLTNDSGGATYVVIQNVALSLNGILVLREHG